MTIADFLDAFTAEIPLRMTSRALAGDGGPSMAGQLLAYLSDGENGHWQRIPDDVDLWRERYLRPMRKALADLSRHPVPKGRPQLHVVLWALGTHGSVDAAIMALQPEYAWMWQPVKARRWVSHALFELARVYREDVPMRVYRKSESQSIAEAA